MTNRYSAQVANVANTAAGEPIQVNNTSGAPRVRGSVYEFIISSGATPGDGTTRWFVDRVTAIGSGGALVTTPLDPGSQSSVAEARSLASPTVLGVPLMTLSINQRVTYRWVAAPNAALVFAAADSAGLCIQSGGGTGTYNCDFTIMWQE